MSNSADRVEVFFPGRKNGNWRDKDFANDQPRLGGIIRSGVDRRLELP